MRSPDEIEVNAVFNMITHSALHQFDAYYQCIWGQLPPTAAARSPQEELGSLCEELPDNDQGDTTEVCALRAELQTMRTELEMARGNSVQDELVTGDRVAERGEGQTLQTIPLSGTQTKAELEAHVSHLLGAVHELSAEVTRVHATESEDAELQVLLHSYREENGALKRALVELSDEMATVRAHKLASHDVDEAGGLESIMPQMVRGYREENEDLKRTLHQLTTERVKDVLHILGANGQVLELEETVHQLTTERVKDVAQILRADEQSLELEAAIHELTADRLADVTRLLGVVQSLEDSEELETLMNDKP